MAFNFIWLSGNPDVEKHARKANEARSAAFYATYKILWRVVSTPLRRLFGSIGHARRVSGTRRELSALGGHLLQDIGIERGDIPAVAEALAVRTPKSGPRLERSRRAEVTDTAGSELRGVPLPDSAQSWPETMQAPRPQPVNRPAKREKLAA